MEITDEVKSKLSQIFNKKLAGVVARQPVGDSIINWGLSSRIDEDWKECLENLGIVLGFLFAAPPNSVVIRDPLFPSRRWIAINQELAMKIMVLGEFP